jgi:D-amino-acid dehydrogenase
VVGGGVIGVCAAYYLARDGWAVTLIEKGEVASGSSWGNAGLIVPSHSIPLAAPGVWQKGLRWMADPESPFYIRPRLDRELVRWLWQFRRACTTRHLDRAVPVLRDLGYASLALYRELAGIEGFQFGFEENGVLAVYRTAKGFAEGRHEAERLGRSGIGVDVLDAGSARALEPSLGPDLAGAVLFKHDAQLIPDRFVTGLCRVAERLGVEVRRSTDVLGFRTRDRRVVAVDTTRGEIEAGEVVLAAGAWSPALGRDLGLRLPIQPAKGYSVTCRRPADGPRIPVLLGEAKMAVTPMADTLRFAGTLELAGLDLSVNRRRVAAVVRAAGHFLPGADRLPVVEIWRGLRPVTPDGLPIVGRAPGWDNVILATGHAMIGISLGPVTGKLVAQLAGGQPPLVDPRPLRLERFG